MIVTGAQRRKERNAIPPYPSEASGKVVLVDVVQDLCNVPPQTVSRKEFKDWMEAVLARAATGQIIKHDD